MDFRDFHKKSGVSSIREQRTLFRRPPAPTKTYPRFPYITLPTPALPEMPYAQALHARASRRDFDISLALPLEHLSDILAAGAGPQDTPSRNGDIPSRRYPSGGALYPLECYVASYRVTGAETGLYHYDPFKNRLEKLPGSTESVWESCADLVPAALPACIIIVTAMWDRSYPKYGEFAYRLGLLEAGHIVQNMLVCAAARSVKTLPAAAFRQEPVSRALDIADDAEDPLYLCFLGL